MTNEVGKNWTQRRDENRHNTCNDEMKQYQHAIINSLWFARLHKKIHHIPIFICCTSIWMNIFFFTNSKRSMARENHAIWNERSVNGYEYESILNGCGCVCPSTMKVSSSASNSIAPVIQPSREPKAQTGISVHIGKTQPMPIVCVRPCALCGVQSRHKTYHQTATAVIMRMRKSLLRLQ